MIEDKELRELFKVESKEYFSFIEEGLIALEKSGKDPQLLEKLFRDVHSLKGSARMVGQKQIELLAHEMESAIGAVKKGTLDPTAELIDRLLECLGAAKEHVEEAIGGRPATIEISHPIARLKEAAMPGGSPHPDAGATPEKGEGPRKDAEPRLEDYRIDTIRVETGRLDNLFTHTGELVVMKTRLLRIINLIEDASTLLETMVKKGQAAPAAGRNASARAGTVPPSGYLQLEKLEGIVLNARDALREEFSSFEYIASALSEGIREVRLLPFSGLFGLFPRMVRELARERGKEVVFETTGGEVKADKQLIEELKDPLMHILRNAVDHGVESHEERARAGKTSMGRITLSALKSGGHIIIEISDDGAGLDDESVRRTAVKNKMIGEKEAAALASADLHQFIFRSGFSTSGFVTDISGRGVGLDVVRSKVDRLKGTVHIDSIPGRGCTFRIRLPVTLSVTRVLVVSLAGRYFAIPSEYVHSSCRVSEVDTFLLEGRQTISYEGRSISVAALADMLSVDAATSAAADAPRQAAPPAHKPCVILSIGGTMYGLLVDDMIDELEVVLKPANSILKRVRNITGAAVLGSGEICLVLNPYDMLKTLQRPAQHHPALPQESAGPKAARTILLVEDSITTRTQEKRILEGGGYLVVTAVNGLDALEKLAVNPVDAVVSDVLMPEMDGLALTAKIRQDKKLADMPVILVTTLSSSEDKRKGLEVGANAYIPKPSFDQKVLLETLERLL